MSDKVIETIEALKTRMNASTDAELARKLRIDKSTVSSWKSRGNVPDRFIKILDGDSHQVYCAPPSDWGDHEGYAFSLALFRFSRWSKGIIKGGDFKSIMTVFDTSKSIEFWLFLNQAQQDLVVVQEGGQHSIDKALSFVLYDEIDDPEAGEKRDQARIAEMLGTILE